MPPGVSLEALGTAMAALAERHGGNPLFELETGRMTEAAFLRALGDELTDQLGRDVEMHGFGERSSSVRPNARMIDYVRELRGRGYKLALTPAEFAQLTLQNPRLWWPNG